MYTAVFLIFLLFWIPPTSLSQSPLSIFQIDQSRHLLKMNRSKNTTVIEVVLLSFDLIDKSANYKCIHSWQVSLCYFPYTILKFGCATQDVACLKLHQGLDSRTWPHPCAPPSFTNGSWTLWRPLQSTIKIYFLKASSDSSRPLTHELWHPLQISSIILSLFPDELCSALHFCLFLLQRMA